MELDRPPADELEYARRYFFNRLNKHFDLEATEKIEDAYLLASKLHEGQAYGGGSYDVHLFDVANNCLDLGFTQEKHWELMCAALLHDAVENKQCTERIMTMASHAQPVRDKFHALEVLTNSKIANIVKPVTNTPLTDEQEATFGKTQRFDHYYDGVETRLFTKDAGWESIVIKIADNLANVRKLGTKDWAGIVLHRTNKYWRLPDLFDLLITTKADVLECLSDEQLLGLANAVEEIRQRLRKAILRIEEDILLAHLNKHN